MFIMRKRAVLRSRPLSSDYHSLFAVGLVSLPGMMTGQILSGISPLIAVRYQIMVMCMIFGSAGLSSACFLFSQIPRAKVCTKCEEGIRLNKTVNTKRGNGNKNFTYFCNGPFSFNSRSTAPMEPGETHLNPNTGRTLHDGVYLFPTD